MANNQDQTIQDSRRAAMSFLEAAKAKEERRNNKETPGVPRRRTKVGRAVDGFLRAGRRKEARQKPKDGGETPSDLAQRIRRMSDDEFDEAMRSGAISPEQLRKAGEYEWDTYMGDVWSENADNDDVPEPTYDEFIADPRKYGVTYSDEDAAGDPDADIYPVNWGRYRRRIAAAPSDTDVEGVPQLKEYTDSEIAEAERKMKR